MAFTDKLRDYVFPLSTILTVVSAVFLTLSTIWVMKIEDAKVSFIKDYWETVDAWNWWVFVLSLIGLFVGVMYLYMYIKDSRRFEELIDTKSKKTFLKNMQELEDLAWRLPSSYRERFYDKKEELKITK